MGIVRDGVEPPPSERIRSARRPKVRGWSAREAARDADRSAGADPETAERACNDDAVRLLAMRERTKRGLLLALVQRSHDREVAAAVIDRLAAAGWVDDARYARLRLESAARGRPRSIRALSAELRRDGCDEETVRAAIGDVREQSTGLDELDLARRLVRKKLRSARADREKVRRALARAGFPPGVIGQALREIVDRGTNVERDGEGNGERAAEGASDDAMS
jgi:regulatory protein